MSLRRLLLFLCGTLLIAGAIVGGYLAGSSDAASEREATAERRGSARVAFAVARVEALATAVDRGRSDGNFAGARDGRVEGSQDGFAAGKLAATNRVDAIRARTEPENDTTPGPLDLDGEGGVLVVGDSLQVLTSPYLEKYLEGVPVTVNAEGGYNSIQILELFKESYDPSQSVIVFDAGTNDNPAYPEILATNLDAVSEIVGNRCLVVPTIHGFTVDGVDNTGKNGVVADFAASRPGTQTPDWAGAVAAHPELMQADNLHPIAEGADLRARLIARGVQACLGSDTSLTSYSP